MSRFVEVENNVIIGHYSGEKPEDGRFQTVPEDLVFSIGDDRRNWDRSWNLRPRGDRVNEGLLEIPSGQKLVDGMFVPMSLAERLLDGSIERPKGYVLDESGTAWRAASLAEQVELGDTTLAELKVLLKARIEDQIPARRKAGFFFGGVTYQADPGVSEAVNGLLTAISSGVPVSFPFPWRSGDNQRPSWPDKETFISFAATLLSFVNGLYKMAWDSKDAIDAAQSADDVGAAFDAGGWE